MGCGVESQGTFARRSLAGALARSGGRPVRVQALKLSSCIVVAMTVVVAPGCVRRVGGSQESSREPVSISYVETAGGRCMEPIVSRGQPKDSDFVTAELQWLAANYPGYRLKRQSLQALLPPLAPENHPSPRPNDDYRDQDSIELETSSGEQVALCFWLSPRSSNIK